VGVELVSVDQMLKNPGNPLSFKLDKF